jgi:hypothetical protein
MFQLSIMSSDKHRASICNKTPCCLLQRLMLLPCCVVPRLVLITRVITVAMQTIVPHHVLLT